MTTKANFDNESLTSVQGYQNKLQDLQTNHAKFTRHLIQAMKENPQLPTKSYNNVQAKFDKLLTDQEDLYRRFMVDFHVEIGASKVFVNSPGPKIEEDEIEDVPVWTEEEKNLVD